MQRHTINLDMFRENIVVVPSMSVFSITLSEPDKAFNRLDFPAFGFPASTTLIPFTKKSTLRGWLGEPDWYLKVNLFQNLLSIKINFFPQGINCCFKRKFAADEKFYQFVNFIWPWSERIVPMLPALTKTIRSVIASACSRSIYHFRNAASENSTPGLAILCP